MMDGTPHDFSGKAPRGPRRTSAAAKLPKLLAATRFVQTKASWPTGD